MHPILILLLLASHAMYAQEDNPPTLLQQLGISETSCYYFTQPNASDSTLVTKAYYNSSGYLTRYDLFSDTICRTSYRYEYRDDTLKVKRNTYSYDTLSSFTKIINNEFGQATNTYDFDADGRRTGWSSVTKYNKHQRVIDSRIMYRGQIITREKWYYYHNGHIRKYHHVDPKGRSTVFKYSRNGLLKWQIGGNETTTEAPIPSTLSSGELVVRRTKWNFTAQIITVSGKTNVASRDKLVQEQHYDANGLLSFERDYLNDKLLGVKRYYYK